MCKYLYNTYIIQYLQSHNIKYICKYVNRQKIIKYIDNCY